MGERRTCLSAATSWTLFGGKTAPMEDPRTIIDHSSDEISTEDVRRSPEALREGP
ncbi:MAG: hypothetical protein ACLTLQ_01075 [[Clostridium] scindens]